MEGAEEELERRSKFLNSLIQKKKAIDQQQEQHNNVRVRACDMPLPLQNRAFRCARDHLDSMPGKKLDSKRLALALKKEFDSSYGPAWHCIVGTSFGSYVTHSLGGFLYFSIDKVYKTWENKPWQLNLGEEIVPKQEENKKFLWRRLGHKPIKHGPTVDE